MRYWAWLAAIGIGIMALGACHRQALRPDRAIPAGAVVSPEPPSAADESEVAGIRFTRVARSEPASPGWTAQPSSEDQERVFQVGKGSSLASAFEAQQAAMHEAVGIQIRRLLGERTKYRTTVEVKPDGPRMWVRIVALIGFEPNAAPVRVEGFEVSAVYNEIWAGNGQRIYVAWVRMAWPQSARRHLLAEHSI